MAFCLSRIGETFMTTFLVHVCIPDMVDREDNKIKGK